MTNIYNISHHIFLTKEQRYALSEYKKIDVVGTHVVDKTNRNTHHTNKEIFCKYTLYIDKNPGIKLNNNVYEITFLFNDSPRDQYSMEQTLLDVEDGGNGGYLFYKYKNVYEDRDIFHSIQLKPMWGLIESLDK